MKKKILFNANVFIVGFTMVLLFGFGKTLQAQEKKYQVSCVAFYNLENLFDTINSPDTNDEEFTNTGAKVWTTEKYQKSEIP